MFTPDQLQELRDAAAGVVHAFVWKQGKRGGRYWLPDGKEDVPGNRLYGQAAQRAARRAEGTTPAPAPASPASSPPPAPVAPQWTDEDRRDFEMRPEDPAVAAAVPDFNILDIIDAEPLSSPEPDAATSATADPEGTTTWGTPELAADWSRHAGTVTPHQVVGAPPGSRVVVRTSPDGDFLVDVSHPAIAECRRLVHAKGGKRYVKNLTFVAKGEHQNSGLGADVFARQVAELSAAGFSHIECYAAGPPYNGYATWPRFGYDQAIDTLESSQQAKVRRKFPDAKSVLDILATPEGRDWWMGKKGPDGKRTGGNGFSLPRAVFDLRPGSRSMRVMAAYLAEKAAAKKSPSPPSKKPPSIGPGKSSAAGSRPVASAVRLAQGGAGRARGRIERKLAGHEQELLGDKPALLARWRQARWHVLNALPPRVLTVLDNALGKVRPVVGGGGMAGAYIQDDPADAGRPSWLDRLMLRVVTAGVRGAYDTKTRNVAVRADISELRGTLAHELSHAVDGSLRVSSSPEWRRAWEGELATKWVPAWLWPSAARLTWYAAENPEEGFAEFARAVWGGNVPLAEIERKFPTASGVLKAQQLWPTAGQARDKARERYQKIRAAGYEVGRPPTLIRRVRRTLGFSEVYRYAGWGDWKQIEGGKWRSPGGRVLSDAAYQKLSKGKAGTPAPTPKPEEPPKPEEKPGLIRRAWNATYGAAKERYGPRTAGAMAAAVALPIPGSILAVPALAAIGEIDRALTGGPKKPSPTQPNPVPPKKPDPALGIARAKAEVARAAADAARKPGSGVEPDRVAWLEARARKAEDDLKKLGG